MIFGRSFLVCLTCLFWCLEESKVYAFAPNGNFGSISASFNSSNSSWKTEKPAFLLAAIPDALIVIAQTQILNSIVPFVLVNVVNPRAIGNWPFEHRPNNPVIQVMMSGNKKLFVALFAIGPNAGPASFGIMSRSLPCLEMPWTGELFNRSWLPSKYASFGVVTQEPVKFICAGNFLAFLASREYSVFIVGSHVSDCCMVADVGLGQVSFLDPARF